MTLTLPDGRKLRSTSKRRYHLIVASPGSADTKDPFVLRRSDSYDTIRAALRKQVPTLGLIFDSTDGRLVYKGYGWAHYEAKRQVAVEALPREGLDRCACGAKYWDGLTCASCGDTWPRCAEVTS